MWAIQNYCCLTALLFLAAVPREVPEGRVPLSHKNPLAHAESFVASQCYSQESALGYFRSFFPRLPLNIFYRPAVRGQVVGINHQSFGKRNATYSPAKVPPLMARTMYCLPLSMYVIGEPLCGAGK
jgi:hypothetical protein